MTRVFNKRSLKVIRRKLRKSMPNAEKLFWAKVRNKQLLGYKFRRQYSITDNFVVDFYCPKLKLAIELDGRTHNLDNEIKFDKFREEQIEKFGIKILRFKNNDVFNNLDGVIQTIIWELPERTPPANSLLGKEEELNV